MMNHLQSILTRFAFVVFLGALLFLPTSCSKPTPAAVVAAVGLGSMSATCNGTSIAFVPAASLNSGKFTIIGGQTSTVPNEQIVIYTSASAIGTYPLGSGVSAGGNMATFGTGPSSSNMTNFRTDSTHTGTLHITSFDAANKTMSGNFSFTAVQFSPTSSTATSVITNGVFAGVKWN
jgi:hypothetical protein